MHKKVPDLYKRIAFGVILSCSDLRGFVGFIFTQYTNVIAEPKFLYKF